MRRMAPRIALAALLIFPATLALAYDFSGELLEYEFGWKGIPAANARVTIRDRDCNGPCYHVTIELTGKRYLDLFWKVRDRFEMICSKRDFSLRRYIFFQREGNFFLDTEIRLDEAAGLLRSTRFRVDKKKRYRDKSAPAKGTFGPLSSLLYMRSLPLRPGDEESIRVFDGKRTHTLSWRVVGVERIRIPLGEFEALKVVPRITRSSSRDKRGKVEKVRRVILWISRDPSHTILKIESKAFVGSIYADLTRRVQPSR